MDESNSWQPTAIDQRWPVSCSLEEAAHGHGSRDKEEEEEEEEEEEAAAAARHANPYKMAQHQKQEKSGTAHSVRVGVHLFCGTPARAEIENARNRQLREGGRAGNQVHANPHTMAESQKTGKKQKQHSSEQSNSNGNSNSNSHSIN